MKPAIKWSLILVILFILVMTLSFVGLVYTSPIQTDEIVSIKNTNVNRSHAADDISHQKDSPPGETLQIIDSLKNIIKKNTGDNFFIKITVDSLSEALEIKNELIENQLKQIEFLEKQVQVAEQKGDFLKELTKTYETMKVTEIRPILEKLDNATIIALYKNMSGRTRKNLINGLSSDRAAQITKELAGTQ